MQVKSLVMGLDHYFQYHFVPPGAPAAHKMFNLVRRRDRGSVLAWLVRARPEQREVFKRFMQGMQATDEGLLDKLIYEVNV